MFHVGSGEGIAGPVSTDYLSAEYAARQANTAAHDLLAERLAQDARVHQEAYVGACHDHLAAVGDLLGMAVAKTSIVSNPTSIFVPHVEGDTDYRAWRFDDVQESCVALTVRTATASDPQQLREQDRQAALIDHAYVPETRFARVKQWAGRMRAALVLSVECAAYELQPLSEVIEGSGRQHFMLESKGQRPMLYGVSVSKPIQTWEVGKLSSFSDITAEADRVHRQGAVERVFAQPEFANTYHTTLQSEQRVGRHHKNGLAPQANAFYEAIVELYGNDDKAKQAGYHTVSEQAKGVIKGLRNSTTKLDDAVVAVLTDPNAMQIGRLMHTYPVWNEHSDVRERMLWVGERAAAFSTAYIDNLATHAAVRTGIVADRVATAQATAVQAQELAHAVMGQTTPLNPGNGWRMVEQPLTIHQLPFKR
jgi:hypothetical protein